MHNTRIAGTPTALVTILIQRPVPEEDRREQPGLRFVTSLEETPQSDMLRHRPVLSRWMLRNREHQAHT
jgi:hypothetical protein